MRLFATASRLGALFIFVASTTNWAQAATELGNAVPRKDSRLWPRNVPGARQGGDSVESALPISSLPFADTGTTTGFSNDYDQTCPYSGSVAPDVVYRYATADSELVKIDLCGSSYDTKLYVLDENLDVVACNDDAYYDELCGLYVSALEDVFLGQDAIYYIVIDGYGEEHGPYVVAVTHEEFPIPCVLEPHQGTELEGEPPLVTDYVDTWNGGCNQPEPDGSPRLQEITYFPWFFATWFWGVSGWYTYHGSNYRDTDWFEFPIDVDGVVNVTLTAEQPTYLFELGPHDCAEVEILQSVLAQPCESVTLQITGAPYTYVWIWVGPATFQPPPDFPGNAYHYSLYLDGYVPPDPLPLAGADRAPGCPSIPPGRYYLDTYLGSFHDDYRTPASCGAYGGAGPDVIYEVYMNAGDWLDLEANYSIYPQRDPAAVDTLVVYLVDDLRLNDGSCVDAFTATGHEFDIFTAAETGYQYLIVDFEAGSPYYHARMKITSYASEAPPAPAHDTCAGAAAISYGSFVIDDDLTAARNQYDPLGAGTMGDVVYRLSLLAGDTVELTMNGTGWDEALYLVRDCADPGGSCVAFGVVDGYGGVRLSYLAEVDGDYWLICDSFGIGSRPFTLTGEIRPSLTAVDDDGPAGVALLPAIPNPFNPQTTLSFGLPDGRPCRLAVYSLDGRLVRTLVDGFRGRGRHDVVWDGRNAYGGRVGSGTYICRLEAGDLVRIRTVSLVK